MPWRGEPTVILPITTCKSVFVNAVAGNRRDYAATAVIETFAEARSDRHSTELVLLKSARFVKWRTMDCREGLKREGSRCFVWDIVRFPAKHRGRISLHR